MTIPPPPPPPPVSEAHLLAAQWKHHQDQIKEHQSAAADVAARLLELVPVGGRVELAEKVGIRVQRPNRTFNSDLAVGQLAEVGRAQAEFVTTDWLAIKAVLKVGGRLDLCMLPGTGNATVVAL